MTQPLQLDESRPYYEQIRDYLLTNIESGTFPPHTQIPSERSLSDQFGVSRMTVKHAIQELVFSERLYTRVGKGTFVADTPITQQLSTLTSFTEDMKSLGKTTSSKILQADTLRANVNIARALDLTPDGSNVALLKRLRCTEGQPIAIESSYLNVTHCPNILKQHDFTHTSLYHVLRMEYGLRLASAEQRIRARQATKEEAALLEIDVGFPILYITRTTFLDDNTPVEYVESAYRGDRYVFRAKLTNL
jgi:GntR family transcriptional regulator